MCVIAGSVPAIPVPDYSGSTAKAFRLISGSKLHLSQLSWKQIQKAVVALRHLDD